MTALSFTAKEQIIVDAYEAAASVSGVTSADSDLQAAYVAYIKMLNAKVSLHRGFIYLNRFLNFATTDLTTDFFEEFNTKLDAYITFVASGDFAAARTSHNWIISQLDNSELFLALMRENDFDASLFTIAENTDAAAIQNLTNEIDNTGAPVFVPPSN